MRYAHLIISFSPFIVVLQELQSTTTPRLGDPAHEKPRLQTLPGTHGHQIHTQQPTALVLGRKCILNNIFQSFRSYAAGLYCRSCSPQPPKAGRYWARRSKTSNTYMNECLADVYSYTPFKCFGPRIVDRLVGQVVKASASRVEGPGFESRLRRDFLGSSHTSDLNIGTPVATLPGAWRYRVSTGTGRPGVSIL